MNKKPSRKSSRELKKAFKKSRHAARNETPSRYRPMKEPSGCALVILAGIGVATMIAGAVMYAVGMVLS